MHVFFTECDTPDPCDEPMAHSPGYPRRKSFSFSTIIFATGVSVRLLLTLGQIYVFILVCGVSVRCHEFERID